LNNLRSVPRGSTRHIVTPKLSTSKFRCSSSKNSWLSVVFLRLLEVTRGDRKKRRKRTSKRRKKRKRERKKKEREEKEEGKDVPFAHTVFLCVCGFL
jgi:hypothetical protein